MLASDGRGRYGRWPPAERSRRKPAPGGLPQGEGVVKSTPLTREKLRTVRKPPDDEGGAPCLREWRPKPAAHKCPKVRLWGSGIWQGQEVVCVGVCQQPAGPSEQNETQALGSARFKRRQRTGMPGRAWI